MQPKIFQTDPDLTPALLPNANASANIEPDSFDDVLMKDLEAIEADIKRDESMSLVSVVDEEKPMKKATKKDQFHRPKKYSLSEEMPLQKDSSDMASASQNSSQTISLSEQHARLLFSSKPGNKWLSNATTTHRVEVRVDWKAVENTLIVFGLEDDRNEFHKDLESLLERKKSKNRESKPKTLYKIPFGKNAVIRFIREQFALLERPLGTVNNLYERMKQFEKLKSKLGATKADRDRRHLNIILMGKAGLRNGRLHVAALESCLKFLLKNTKDEMTYLTREKIYIHYKYVFSAIRHEDYPGLISQYQEMERNNSLPTLNIDKSLMKKKLSVRYEDIADLNRSKRELVCVSSEPESPKSDQELVADELPVNEDVAEPKPPAHESKYNLGNAEREKGEPSNRLPTDSADHSPIQNVNWSLKCVEIVEQCRQKQIKSSRVVDKLNKISEKAAENQLTYSDYKYLKQVLSVLNRMNNE